jgi:hypothetical protein
LDWAEARLVILRMGGSRDCSRRDDGAFAAVLHLPGLAVRGGRSPWLASGQVPVTLAGPLPADADCVGHHGPALPLFEETADLVFDFGVKLALALH